jgi:hypothetical protein
VCVEIENLNARRRLKKRLMAGEPHIDYLVAIGDGGFYIGIYEGGEVLDAVNLPDDVIAFAKLVKYGVETCQTSANLFGHKSSFPAFWVVCLQSRILTSYIKLKVRIAFRQVIVIISKTYAIAHD